MKRLLSKQFSADLRDLRDRYFLFSVEQDRLPELILPSALTHPAVNPAAVSSQSLCPLSQPASRRAFPADCPPRKNLAAGRKFISFSFCPPSNPVSLRQEDIRSRSAPTLSHLTSPHPPGIFLRAFQAEIRSSNARVGTRHGYFGFSSCDTNIGILDSYHVAFPDLLDFNAERIVLLIS